MSLQFCLVRFFKYLKWCVRGGYTQVTLAHIQYPEILKGKKVIITGGSDGLGMAMAKKFISAGAEVLITGRKQEKLQAAVSAVASERLHILQWDVSDMKNMDKCLHSAIKQLGGVNVFINNAAFVTNSYGFSEDHFDKTIATNVKAVYFLCHKVAELMKSQNGQSGGKILNISSVSSYESSTNSYFLSKRAVNAITEGFAKAYAPYNIIVNAIAPGYCNSNFNKVDSAENVYREEPVIKRIIFPEEIADLATFLVSDAANGIVGQTILSDGGSML